MLRLLFGYLYKVIDFNKTKDVLIKLGINFITAGIVGVFINHIVGTDLRIMQSAAVLISFVGLICTLLGLLKRGKE